MLYERFAGFTRFCRLTGYLCSSLPWLPPLYNLRPSTDCNGKWTGRNLMKKEKVSYKDSYQYLDRIFNRKKHELLLRNEIWWVFGLYFRNLFLGILIYLDLETDTESSNLWVIFPLEIHTCKVYESLLTSQTMKRFAHKWHSFWTFYLMSIERFQFHGFSQNVFQGVGSCRVTVQRIVTNEPVTKKDKLLELIEDPQ